MLNPEFRTKWIAALRSGAYRQAKGRMIRPAGWSDSSGGDVESFCSLGVLCDVLCKEDIGLRRAGSAFLFNGELMAARPSEKLRQEIGLENRLMKNVMMYNDSIGLSFDDIAELLENENGSASAILESGVSQDRQ